MERALKWEISRELGAPCADISYCWLSSLGANLIVTMHFSRIVGGFKNDVEIIFKEPRGLYYNWQDQSYGLFELPQELPKFSAGSFAGWTYPSIKILGSKWADLYAARTHTELDFRQHNVTHFVFIALNGLLHVLSQQAPLITEKAAEQDAAANP